MTHTYPIVGAFYRPPAEAILEYLSVGAKLLLQAEPSNQYDPNAIAVIVPQESLPVPSPDLLSHLAGFGVTAERYTEFDAVHVGYIPRDLAANLRANGFPDEGTVSGTFNVSSRGKPQVRVED